MYEPTSVIRVCSRCQSLGRASRVGYEQLFAGNADAFPAIGCKHFRRMGLEPGGVTIELLASRDGVERLGGAGRLFEKDWFWVNSHGGL